MKLLKDKMLNYEVEPPEDNWQAISSKLNTEEAGGKMYSIAEKPRRKMVYKIAVASVLLVLAAAGFWFYFFPDNPQKQLVRSSSSQNDSTKTLVKNSQQNKSTETKPLKNDRQVLPEKKTETQVQKNETPVKQDENIAQNDLAEKKYITISGPEGQPVKISSKAATLIESSSNAYPPKPVWNKKISKWKDIMQANTLAPSMDIVDLSNTLKGQ